MPSTARDRGSSPSVASPPASIAPTRPAAPTSPGRVTTKWTKPAATALQNLTMTARSPARSASIMAMNPASKPALGDFFNSLLALTDCCSRPFSAMIPFIFRIASCAWWQHRPGPARCSVEPVRPPELVEGGIAEVVLLPLRIGTNVLRRHQPRIVTKRLEPAAEVMSAAAGLHADQARRHVGERRFHLAA